MVSQSCTRSKGNYDQAERLYQQALRIIEKGLGPDHPKLVAILSSLAKLHAAKGEFGEVCRSPGASHGSD